MDEEVNRDMTGEADGMNLKVDSKDEVKCETKNKMTSVIGPVQSRYDEAVQ